MGRGAALEKLSMLQTDPARLRVLYLDLAARSESDPAESSTAAGTAIDASQQRTTQGRDTPGQ
jgi:hypothetical protein